MKQQKTIKRKLAFSLVVLATCLLAAEIVLRVIHPQFIQFANSWYRLMHFVGWNDHDLRPNARGEFYTFSNAGKRRFAYQVRTNELAIRCPVRDSTPQPTGVDATRPKIVHCIGDSYTFGWGVGYEQSYPAVLGRMLGPSYKVLNLGVPSFGLAAGAEKSRRVAEVEPPSMVIYWFTDGDFDDDDKTIDVQHASRLERQIMSIKFGLCGHSYVACAPWGLALHFFYKRYLWPQRPPQGGSKLLRTDLYEQMSAEAIRQANQHKTNANTPRGVTLIELAKFDQECRQRGTKFAIIIDPTGENGALVFHEAQRLGIPLVYTFDFSEWQIPDDFHYNAEGNRLLAQFVHNVLFAAQRTNNDPR